MGQGLQDFRMTEIGWDDAGALRAAARPVGFRTGDHLLQPGRRGDGVVILETGFVKVCRAHPERDVVLAIHGPGELLGEIALLDRGEHAADAIALTRGTALRVDAPRFWTLLAERPRLNAAVIGTVTHRLRDAGSDRAAQLTVPSAQRIAARILDLAARFAVTSGEEIVVGVPLSQAELSSWSGVSRETGVRALRRLRELGVVRLEHRRIVITDLGGLQQFAGPASP